MGREVRRVPANWEHPKDVEGNYVPLFDENFEQALSDYKEEASQWALGNMRSHLKGGPKYIARDSSTEGMPFKEWAGEIPKQEDYTPDCPEEERTHYQMYETTSEGTPISPVMESPEVLARWLVDNQASAFADMTATYEQWLAMIGVGWSPSLAISVGDEIITMDSGVAFSAKSRPEGSA